MTALSFEAFTLAACVTELGRAAAAEVADAVEFRMDGAERPIEQLDAYDGTLPVIATNRPQWEGGDAGDSGRLETLERAAGYDAVAAIDVELRSVEEGAATRLLETARTQGTSVIVSWHDFEGTPTPTRLDELLEAASTAGDVGKLAATATSMPDVLDLLVATERHTAAGRRVATMSMGAPGRHSRAIAPLYGSRIGYAPLTSAEATAPGQFTLEELRRLIDTLGA